ncbi:MAG: hypothetical protein ACK5JD_10895 [Mangrovibacterium sp.]
MRKPLLCIFSMLPVFAFGQTEVGPDRYFPLLILAVLVGVPLFVWVYGRLTKGGGKPFFSVFSKQKLQVELLPNRSYRPELLTLLINNGTRRDVDIEAPVLIIRKLWSVRKFRLKGINRAQIYPLYLEKNNKHELRISLSVFFRHDPTLHSYYWARVLLKDTTGRCYSTNYVTLRKSLFS